MTLRAGVNLCSGQIASSQTVQNLLVPSINRRAFTVGASFAIDPKSEINLGYEFNPNTTLNGADSSKGTSIKSKVQVLMLGYQRNL